MKPSRDSEFLSQQSIRRRPVSRAVRQVLAVGGMTLGLSMSGSLLAAGFAASIELSDLDGSDGFVLNGIDEDDRAGFSVSSAGDINGDGVADLIIGARLADPNDDFSGESYVVFGGLGIGGGTAIELSDLDSSDGFVLNGIDGGDRAGFSVSSAGDINGDGTDDLIIGAPYADPNGNFSGEGYVVFGGMGIGVGGPIELSALDGSDGFVLKGIGMDDFSGSSVSSAGDINGDGVADLIIGARFASPNDDFSGESYVVFGGMGIGGSGTIELSDLDGSDGFVLNGIDSFDRSGGSVSSAGDINGDGVDDLIIGAPFAGPNGSSSGESYVVFGVMGIGVGGALGLSDLDGNDGFVLNGIDSNDRSGNSVSSAGDINGDGVADLIISAPYADSNGDNSGESYVVFGVMGIGVGGVIELSDLDGSDGFVLNGNDGSDLSGSSVSSAGDINGDGIDDLIIGARFADPNGAYSGESTVVFGGLGIGVGGVIELSDLDGSDGFVLNGSDEGDQSGYSVSDAGDINGDGVDDLIIGARFADPNGSNSGESYVVFGKQLQCNGQTVNVNLNAGQSPTTGDDVILGTPGTDVINALGGDDVICGEAGIDTINGGEGNDTIFGGGRADILSGGNGEDTIYGESGNDQINGDDGADVLFGGSGADTINGGEGKDEVFGGFGGDIISGGDGYDILNGESGQDQINGDAGEDTISGGTSIDIIFGGPDNDTISGGGSGDTIHGEEGDDTINGDSGDDMLFGQAGIDTINGGRGKDEIDGGSGNDILSGNNDADTIYGGEDDDQISGNRGEDTLFGNEGDDTLSGGQGADALDGGPGKGDSCNGGSGLSDTASAECESTSNIP